MHCKKWTKFKVELKSPESFQNSEKDIFLFFFICLTPSTPSVEGMMEWGRMGVGGGERTRVVL